MASSGTVAQTTVKVADVYDSAVRRCGGDPARLTPEAIEVLGRTLYYLLSNSPNRGVNLWRLYQPLFALYAGQQVYPLNDGDIDCTKVMYRQPTRLSPESVVSSASGTTSYLSDADIETVFTQNATNGNVYFDWGSDNEQSIALIGLLAGSTTSYTLVFETSEDASTWTTVYAPGVTSYVAGEWHWYAIEPAGPARRYFRVRETAGGTMSFAEISLSANWIDVEVSKVNRDIWMTLPNKRAPGDPRQYFFDRQITPQLWLYLVPNNTFNLLAPMVQRQIEDVGDMSGELNIPQKWYQAVVTLLAYMAFLELPDNLVKMDRYNMVKEQALNVSLPDAESDETDGSTFQLLPNLRSYT